MISYNDEPKFNVPVHMSVEFFNKINYLSSEYEKEIGGWITGEANDEGVFLNDLLIPKQTVTAASVDIDPAAGVELVKEFKSKCKDIIGHWHCETGDTPVLTKEYGILTAKEVAEGFQLGKKLTLLSYDLDDKIVETPIKNTAVEEAPEIIEINCLGRTINVTPNHLLYTPEGWKQVKDLTIDDKIAIPKKINLPINNNLVTRNLSSTFYKKISEDKNKVIYQEKRKNLKVKIPKRVNEDLAYLFGILISEGCINEMKSGRLRFNITNNKIEMLTRCQKIIKENFGLETKINPKKPRSNPRFEGDYISPQLICNNSLICRFLNSQEIIIGKGIKRLPNCYSWNKKSRQSLLKGLIEGDGYTEKRENNDKVCFYTKYKELASDFTYLLTTLGKRGVINDRVRAWPGRSNCDFIYQVFYMSKELRLDKINKGRKGISFHKIKKINSLPGEPVYLIEIPKYHNFVCGYGGFISHNSHVKMGCHWSGTDETNMKQIMEPRKFFMFVVSSDTKHLIRLETKKPFRLSIDNLDYVVLDETYEKTKKKMEKEIEKKIKKPEVEKGSVWENYRNPVKTSSVKIYDIDNKKVVDGEVDFSTGEDFELEIADNILAEYKGRSLTLKGLDELVANEIMHSFKDHKPDIEPAGDFTKNIIFNVKRKVARKLLPNIQDVIDALQGSYMGYK